MSEALSLKSRALNIHRALCEQGNTAAAQLVLDMINELGMKAAVLHAVTDAAGIEDGQHIPWRIAQLREKAAALGTKQPAPFTVMDPVSPSSALLCWQEIEAIRAENRLHRKGWRPSERTDDQVLADLQEEVFELIRDPKNPTEMVDVLNVLLHYMQRQGWTLKQIDDHAMQKLSVRFEGGTGPAVCVETPSPSAEHPAVLLWSQMSPQRLTYNEAVRWCAKQHNGHGRMASEEEEAQRCLAVGHDVRLAWDTGDAEYADSEETMYAISVFGPAQLPRVDAVRGKGR